MTRRRPDKLDPRSREARRLHGVVRLEIELPIPDAEALAELARARGLSRGRYILHLLRGTLETCPTNPTTETTPSEPP